MITKDKNIRIALKKKLIKTHGNDPSTMIIEELGMAHGNARIDIALINGVIHGFELKSDADTLSRLPNQMKFYNSILDKVTLVVGKSHLHSVMKMVPDWWGIIIAKSTNSKTIKLYEIREAENNKDQDPIAVASLLWRHEALNILEELGKAKGVRSKSRKDIYQRLTQVLNKNEIKEKIRNYFFTRTNWRSDCLRTPNGD